MRSYGGAGAVWDIWPRWARNRLCAYLRRHAGEFQHRGKPIQEADVLDPIHDQVGS